MAYVKQAVYDAESHVEAVGQDEAHSTSPPCQHVGQEQERQGQSQHHKVIPEDETQAKLHESDRWFIISSRKSVFISSLLVHLFLAHGSKYKTLGDTVYGEEENIAAVASQQSGPLKKDMKMYKTNFGWEVQTQPHITGRLQLTYQPHCSAGSRRKCPEPSASMHSRTLWWSDQSPAPVSANTPGPQLPWQHLPVDTIHDIR